MLSVGFVIIIDIRCVGNIDNAVLFIKESAEPLSRQGQRIRSSRGSAAHWAIFIAFTNKKGPHGQPSF